MNEAESLRGFVESSLPTMRQSDVTKMVNRLNRMGIYTPDDCSTIKEEHVDALAPTEKTQFLEACAKAHSKIVPVMRKSLQQQSVLSGIRRSKVNACSHNELVDTPKHELNILLLGETGVGKSTWINAFANYLKFSTLDEALSSDIFALIHASFSVTDAETFESRTVCTGSDMNEEHITGASSTQDPQTYVFSNTVLTIRLIDTPGIGDTRGPEQDQKNLQKILDHIAHFTEIHAICILLKPNNSRLTVMFKFCIQGLLTQLHKEACHNLVFFFTNCRGRPGETLPALRTLLQNHTEIKIGEKTLYTIDNEAVRYLYAVKNKITFPANEQKQFSESWTNSVAEIEKFIRNVTKLVPHKVKNTLSLNDARRLIVELAKPLEDINANIKENILEIKTEERQLSTAREKTEDLDRTVKDLFIPQVDLTSAPLDCPLLVCIAKKCIDRITQGNTTRTRYCCTCPAKFVSWKRHAWYEGQSSCTRCFCEWDFHVIVKYQSLSVVNNSIKRKIDAKIDENKSKIQILQNHKTELQIIVQEFSEEREHIIRVSQKFAAFLKKNAISPYNTSLLEYLKLCLENSEFDEDRNWKVVLEELREKHTEDSKTIDTAIMRIMSDDVAPTTNDIPGLIDSLYSLKHSGSKLRGLMKSLEEAEKNEIECNERIVDIKYEQKHSAAQNNGLQRMIRQLSRSRLTL